MDDELFDMVVAALALTDEQERETALASLAQDTFATAYDALSPDSADLTHADFLRFTNPLMAAINMTTHEASPELVAGWIGTAAANAAIVAASPPSRRLTWVTMEDEAVRDLHVPMNGVTVASGQPFIVGGFPLAYPGQPIGPPEVWINCRCRLAASMSAAITAAPDGPPPAPKGAVVVAVPADPESLVVEGGDSADQLHVTLGYYTPEMLTPELRATLEEYLRVQDVSDPVVHVGGTGQLGDDDPPAQVLMLESDELNRLRAALEAVAPPDMTHPNFTPHLTLGYGIDAPVDLPESVTLGGVELWWQDEHIRREDLSAAVPTTELTARARNTEQRQELADKGHALPDGSYPIEDEHDLRNAIQAIGRASDPAKARAHIRKRARALGLTELIPDSWTAAVEGQDSTDLGTELTAAPANTHDGPGWLTHPKDTQRLRNYWTKGKGAAKIRWGSPGDLTRCEHHLREYVGPYAWGTCQNMHHVVFGYFNPESRGKGRRAAADEEMFNHVVAAFAAADQLEDEMLPSRALFDDPHLDGPTALTVRAAGDFTEVIGHLASWDTCHVGMEGGCVTAPKSRTAYAYYRTGEVETDAGPVAVGHITAGTGHADPNLGPDETVRHYDHTGTVVADVAAGEDEHGIWAHGIMRPGVSEEQAYALRAGAPSGDWRRIGGNLELVGALIVNVPGFPIPRPQLAASLGRELSLIAAAIVTIDPNAELADRVAIAIERRAEVRAANAARAVRAGAVLAAARATRVERLLVETGA